MNQKKSNFTTVSNDVLNMYGLSWKAKGVWSYMISKPKGWKFSAARMSQQTGEGEKATKAALRELTQIGLLKRVKTREEGKGNKFSGISYILADENQQKTVGLFQAGLKQAGLKQADISNTDISNTDISKKDYLGLFFKKPAISSFLREVADKEGCTEWLSELVGDVWFHRTPSPLPLTDKNLKLLVEGLSHEEGWEYARDRMGGTQYFPLPVIQEAKKREK